MVWQAPDPRTGKATWYLVAVQPDGRVQVIRMGRADPRPGRGIDPRRIQQVLGKAGLPIPPIGTP
jgi:hypothetical protein